MKIEKIFKKMLLAVLIFGLILPVIPAPKSMAAAKTKLSRTKVTLYVGYNRTLILYKGSKILKAKWTSNKKKIATVGRTTGIVTAKSKGTCKITAKYAGKKYTCKVTVKKRSSNPSYTPEPIYTPTPEPVYTPTPEPIYTPTPEPVYTPTPEPVYTPTPKPVYTPTPEPIYTPTPKPVYTPTPEPVYTPTPKPVYTPTPKPVYTPTPEPSNDINVGDSNSIHYLTPYQTENIKIYDNDLTSSFTMMGVKYHQGIIPKNWGDLKIALYNLDSKFNTVSFDVGHLDDNHEADVTMYIYTDNVLVESIDLTSNMTTCKMTINTTNVQQLRIEYNMYGAFYGIGNVIGYGGHIFQEEVTKIANVLRDGVKTYTCKYCGESYTETLPAQKKCTPHLKPYQTKNGKIYNNDGESYFTVMGKRYYEGVIPANWGDSKEWLYNLKNQFSSVTFSVGHCDNEHRKDVTMYVYADGVKVKEINLESDMISERIIINTDGVTQLKFAYDMYGAFYAIYDMDFNSNTEIEHSFIEEIDEKLGVTRYICENCGSFYIE